MLAMLVGSARAREVVVTDAARGVVERAGEIVAGVPEAGVYLARGDHEELSRARSVGEVTGNHSVEISGLAADVRAAEGLRHPRAVDAAGAWAGWGARGSGQTVAVVDTGVDRVAWIRRATNESAAAGLPGVDEDQNGVVDDVDGARVADGEASGRGVDVEGHGTLVAGLVAEVAPGAEVLSLAVVDEHGEGTDFDVAQAITYAVNEGAAIVNVSASAEERVPAMEAAIRYATGRGALVVVAAGNEGRSLEQEPRWLAAYEIAGMVAVASVNEGGWVAAHSSYSGSEVELAVPGEDVRARDQFGMREEFSGTSAGAAVASGAAAVVGSVGGGDGGQVIAALEGGVRRLRGVRYGTVSVAGALQQVRADLEAPERAELVAVRHRRGGSELRWRTPAQWARYEVWINGELEWKGPLTRRRRHSAVVDRLRPSRWRVRLAAGGPAGNRAASSGVVRIGREERSAVGREFGGG